MPSLTQNIHDIIYLAFEQPTSAGALIVYDRRSLLANALTDAYLKVLPHAWTINFDTTTPDEIKQTINKLKSGDLVIMVQSTSFRLNEFRFRLELFNRSLAVIEHPHLGRMMGEEAQTYMDALAYDRSYYRTVGHALKQKIDSATCIVVEGEHTQLVYQTRMEDTKLNIGDYTGMKNRGGQFPIGEVFTEPVDWNGVNGTVDLLAYGNVDFRVSIPTIPIRLHIQNGIIINTENATDDFQAILDEIVQTEPLWVRELGFGMNRAMSPSKRVDDIGSYERMCGIHLSLGQKHTIYAKPGMPKRSSKYHVDVFPDTKRVLIDDVVVYENNGYVI